MDLILYKTAHILFSTLIGLFSGYADVNSVWKWQSKGEKRIAFDKKYHNYQTLERIFGIFVGMLIVLSASNIYQLISNAVLTLIYSGIFHNLFQNVARGKPLFWISGYQKKNNTSGFEKFSGAGWQIGAFAAVTVVNYLIYELL